MKSNFYKFKITFAILFGTLLSISPFNPVRLTNPKDILEVCAQDIGWDELGTGVSCVPNYSSCANGENLAKLITSMRYGSDINQTQLLKSLEDAYGDNARQICISQEISSTIVRWMTPGEYEASGICTDAAAGSSCQNIPQIRAVTSGGQSGTIYGVPRYCPAGWTNQNAPNKLNQLPGTGTVSGCCPSTHTFVNVAEQSSGEAVQAGICCKKPQDGRVPGVYIVEGGFEPGCYTKEEDQIYTIADVTSQAPGTFATLEEALEAASDANLIVGIKFEAGVGYTPSISYDERNQSNVIKPAFGLGYGLGFPGGGVTISSTALSAKRCPPSSACVFFENAAIDSFPANVQVSSGVTIFDLPASKNLKCDKCFNEGEPMVVDSTTQRMFVCDPSAADGRTPIALCNASVIDTIACLGGSNSTSQNANSQGVGSTNYDLCCACRVQGGVWTGIGCTDTTPAGLITGLIRIVYGVMGGLALVMLIYAGIMYQTGNEANVKQARESIIRTITGLIVLTFSILILRIIGINVLDILPSGSI